MGVCGRRREAGRSSLLQVGRGRPSARRVPEARANLPDGRPKQLMPPRLAERTRLVLASADKGRPSGAVGRYGRAATWLASASAF